MVGKGDYFLSSWVSAYFQWQLLLVSGRVDETWWNPKWTFPKAFESPYQLDPLKSWDKPDKPINLKLSRDLVALVTFLVGFFGGPYFMAYEIIAIITELLSSSPTNGCFLQWWYPQIIHSNRVFHYKPSILGYPYFLETPKSLKQPGFSITAQPATCPTAWAVRTTIAVPIVAGNAGHAFGGMDESKINRFEYRIVDVYICTWKTKCTTFLGNCGWF